ncbi:MAG: hypothetical protein FWF84_04340 [Kiritimatiellaeota bacterium]|nr:hypothetical protein [Kiritimatiellota bacterium]
MISSISHLRYLRLKLGTLSAVVAAVMGSAAMAAQEGVHVSTTVDDDGDEVILMESEWISMSLLPWRQALIHRFVFRPTNNDIVAPTNPKHRFGGGGGILMDCFWEQDWRFQELAYKGYPYTITKNGPDEAQVVFETNIKGFLGADNSGIISPLLSNLTLRRTVTLKAGQPFFRFDFEFINNDRWAKRPSFWVHNSSFVARGNGKDTVVRPSDRGLTAIGGDQEAYAGPQGQQFVDNFTAGWSGHLSKERREGIVYLMDYDYVDKLYNCFPFFGSNGTQEWWYDAILAFRDRPWQGRVYILPMIGLSRLDHANPYFICALDGKREDGRLTMEVSLTASYESVSRVTLVPEIRSGLLEDSDAKTIELEPIVFDSLAIQPTTQRVTLDFAYPDPLVWTVKAFVELPEGGMKTYTFQRFYAGDYALKSNLTRVGGDPIVTLDRAVKNPHVPEVPSELEVNRSDFKVFGVHGIGAMRLGLDEAVASQIPGATYEIGYAPGCDVSMNGLTDFPYDYERLYDFRVMVIANAMDKEFRRVGASILRPWLEAKGGLVLVGGPFAYAFEYEEHPLYDHYPLVPGTGTIRKEPTRLCAPDVPEHPIFGGIDFGDLPWVFYPHKNLRLKDTPEVRVLMRCGDEPFIIERIHDGQRTIAVAVNAFGEEKDFGNKTAVRNWDQWPALFANIVRYCGQ